MPVCFYPVMIPGFIVNQNEYRHHLVVVSHNIAMQESISGIVFGCNAREIERSFEVKVVGIRKSIDIPRFWETTVIAYRFFINAIDIKCRMQRQVPACIGI